MAWPIYHNPSLKFFKTCAVHHQQTTYASIWNAVDELWLLLHPTQCFQLFRVCFVRQLGNWKLACLPHSWTEKSCLLNWVKREFGTAVLTGCQDYRWDWQRANRTCLSIMKEKKGGRNAEADIQRVANGQALLYFISMWRWTMTEVDFSEMKNGKLMGV